MSIILICDNCEDVINELPPIDMVLTDPAFGISNIANVDNFWNGYTSNKGDWDIPPGTFWIDECVNILKDGGIFSCFGVFGSLVPIFISLMKNGMKFQSHPVWEKSNPAPSVHRRMYTYANEIILVFSKGSNWTFNYEDAKALAGGKQLKNVWKAGSQRRILDRTRKAPHVLDRLILPLTNEGDWLLDPFCGTCCIVERAAMHAVNVIGIDNDPEVIEWSYNDLISKGYNVEIR